jgi:hypothetical protein
MAEKVKISIFIWEISRLRTTRATRTTLRDMKSGGLMVGAFLTPASYKRIIKEYSRFGYYLEVITK